MDGRKSAADAFPRRDDWRPAPAMEPSRRRLVFTAVMMCALACVSVVFVATSDGLVAWANGAAGVAWAISAAATFRQLARRTGERDS